MGLTEARRAHETGTLPWVPATMKLDVRGNGTTS